MVVGFARDAGEARGAFVNFLLAHLWATHGAAGSSGEGGGWMSSGFSGITAGIVDGSSQFIQLNGRFLACVSSALHLVKCVHDVLW